MIQQNRLIFWRIEQHIVTLLVCGAERREREENRRNESVLDCRIKNCESMDFAECTQTPAWTTRYKLPTIAMRAQVNTQRRERRTTDVGGSDGGPPSMSTNSFDLKLIKLYTYRYYWSSVQRRQRTLCGNQGILFWASLNLCFHLNSLWNVVRRVLAINYRYFIYNLIKFDSWNILNKLRRFRPSSPIQLNQITCFIISGRFWFQCVVSP